MTSRFVVDASAWIEYLQNSEKGEKISKILENKENELICPCTVLSEVISKFLKMNKDIAIAKECLKTLSVLIPINEGISALAGQIHFEEKKKNKDFGMLDAFVVAAAKKLNAKILTGDNDFKHFKEAVII